MRQVTMEVISKVLHLSIAEYGDGDMEETIPGTLFTVVNNLEIYFLHSETMVTAIHFLSEMKGNMT